MSEKYGKMTWQAVAERLQEEIEVNWEEEFLICPFCNEPILSDDWEEIEAEEDEEGILRPFCPICGFFFED